MQEPAPVLLPPPPPPVAATGLVLPALPALPKAFAGPPVDVPPAPARSGCVQTAARQDQILAQLQGDMAPPQRVAPEYEPQPQGPSSTPSEAEAARLDKQNWEGLKQLKAQVQSYEHHVEELTARDAALLQQLAGA